MNQWHKDNVRQAFSLFTALLRDGSLNLASAGLKGVWSDPEVQEILHDVIAREADVAIIAHGDEILLVPNIGSTLFATGNAELRAALRLDNNSQLYTGWFALLCLCAMIYNTADGSPSRDFVPLEDLERNVNEHLETVRLADAVAVADLSLETGLTLKEIAEVWSDLNVFDTDIKNLRRGRKNRMSFLLRFLKFFEDNQLVRILDDREIHPLPRFEAIMRGYFGVEERKKKLLHLLSQSLPLTAREEVN